MHVDASSVIIIMNDVFGLIFSASAQNFTCNVDISKPLCPGTVINCICAVTGTVSQTRWIFSSVCPSTHNYISFPQLSPCSSSTTCGPYITATNLVSSGGSCQTSKLTVTMMGSISGLGTECRDLSTGLPGALIGSASFISLGKQQRYFVTLMFFFWYMFIKTGLLITYN